MGKRIWQLDELSSLADDDKSVVLDESDKTGGAEGTSKFIEESTRRDYYKNYFDTLYEPLAGGSTISNKKWTIFGDSFSNDIGADYPYYVIQKTGMTGTVTNAVSGDKILDQLNDLDTILAGTPAYFNAYDICSLHIGINDYAADTDLGAITDTAASATYAGYLMDFIETVLSSKEDIQLYIMSFPDANGGGVTYEAANGNGDTVKDFRDLIKAVCEKYGVKFIDLWATCQFNLQTISSLTSDGLHPNATGGNILGDIVANSFISYNRG